MNKQTEYHKLTPGLIEGIKLIVGEKGVLTEEGRENYARDEAPHPHTDLPEAVIFPRNTQEIAAILKLASAELLPVTPRGAGTGLSGGSVPACGGLVLSLEKINSIIEIDEANFCATAGSGVVLADFCEEIEKHGLYYPLYPGEMSATIGGNVATNAGGMRAVKYGVTRDFVLGLEAVLPTGEIITTGGKYVKSSTGYDLTQLLTGSEGTLAIISQVTLQLITPPGSREILLIPFNTLSEAIRCVPVILKERILPVSIEFMESDILQLVKDYTGKEFPIPGYPAYLMLMIESENYDEFGKISERISEICLKNGAVDTYVPGSQSAKRRLLETREKFYPTMQHRGMLDLADVVVPRSKIADFIEEVKRISQRYGIPVVGYGHAGDGNVHLHPLGPKTTSEKVLQELLSEIYRAGIALGGTISGEHGIGSAKRKYMPLACSPEKLALMRRIKDAFDPNNILNPGKVI
jgi:glycolate oxidase